MKERYLPRRITVCAAIAIIALSKAVAGPRVLRIGDLAPPLRLGQIVEGQINTATSGRAMLLEFWAIYCPPCRAAIPHLNQLAERFRTQPIDFVSINVFEDAVAIRKFLADHRMEGVVAVDGSPGMADAYGLEGIPVTVLISREGRIAAITQPSQVTPEVIDDLLSGKGLHLPDVARSGVTAAIPTRRSYTSGIGPEDRSLVRVVVIPTAKQGGTVSSSDQFESTGANLRDLLSYAYDIPPLRIFLPSLLEDEKYEIQAWVPKDSPETLQPLLQAAITSAAGITARREKREMDAFMLEGFPGKLTRVIPKSSLFKAICEAGEMSGEGASITILQQCIQKALGKSVIIPARVDGSFSYAMKWDPSKPSTFETVLRNQLGLTLTPTRRTFDVLVVGPVGH